MRVLRCSARPQIICGVSALEFQAFTKNAVLMCVVGEPDLVGI